MGRAFGPAHFLGAQRIFENDGTPYFVSLARGTKLFFNILRTVNMGHLWLITVVSEKSKQGRPKYNETTVQATPPGATHITPIQ